MASGELQIDDGAALSAPLGEHVLQHRIKRLRERRQARHLLLLDRQFVLRAERPGHNETEESSADPGQCSHCHSSSFFTHP
jgi:hypothetical protein